MNPQISLPSYDIDHVFGYDSLVHSVHMLGTQANAGSCKWQIAGCKRLAICYLQPATLPTNYLTRTAYVEDASL